MAFFFKKSKTNSINYDLIAIIIISLIVLVKAIFLFSNVYFEDNSSYYHLDRIENFFNFDNEENLLKYNNVQDMGINLFYFAYSIFFTIFPSIITIKILELFQIGILILLIYLLSKDLSSSELPGIFSIFLLVSMPLLFISPQNTIRPEIFILNLIFITIYFLLKSSILFNEEIKENFIVRFLKKIGFTKTNISQKNYLLILIFLTAILSLVSDYSLILVVTLLIYLIFAFLLSFSTKEYFKEFTIFFCLCIISAYLFFSKELFINFGFSIFKGNFPTQFMNIYSEMFNILNSFLFIGVIIFLGGIYSVYFYFNNLKLKESKKIVFYISGVVACFISLILNVGNSYFILFFAGVCLNLCFSSFVGRWIESANKNYKVNLNLHQYWIIIVCIIFIFGTSIHYSLASNITNKQEYISLKTIDAYSWVNTVAENKNKTLLITSYDQSYLANYFSKTKYLIGNNFLRVDDSTNIIKNLDEIYKNINSIKIKEILNEYILEYHLEEVYIYFDENIGLKYSIAKPGFDYDSACFLKVYINNDITIYKYLCGENNG